jgi:hypothetical protein
MRSSDEVEDDHTYDDDSKTLTKADRRNIKLVIQGLGYWLGGVIGYCSIFLLTTILSFLFSVISQGISTFEGHRTVNSIFEVFGWIIVIATLLNTLLYLGGKILILFTPWKTGATLWFILSLVFTVALIGFRIFLIAREGAWGRSLMTYLFGLTIAGKLYFCINEVLFICMWLLMIVGLWRLMKFSRKPNIRMRVILMGMLGTGFWVVLVIIPLLSEYFPVSSQIALWVVVTLKLLLTLAMGGFMLFQHYTIVNEVCSELARAK